MRYRNTFMQSSLGALTLFVASALVSPAVAQNVVRTTNSFEDVCGGASLNTSPQN